MNLQAFQPGEIRDEQDNIIRPGAYGKKTALVTADNVGILDYIMNNFDALYDMINAHKTYVASKTDLPATGDAGTVYVASDTGVWYGWDAVKKAYVAYSDPRTAADEAAASETAAKASETAAASQKAAATSEANASQLAANAANASASANTAATSAASSASTASAKLDAVNSALKIATDTLAQAQKLTTANGGLSVYVDSDGHLCYRIIATA